ncbi:MAG TPA: helix-turn-helix domain-containing protein [Flavobacterium sp.]|uniref:helix-turn-helix domain-containing protein n=1 Tax=Flavobacterium sp. TaxID=239 RepID=UPI002C956F30|nr:helix-turn-helix domain-containing protein [Flavobacterium sp.]HSD15407.1 helix-turn-helix domain-containing protein [Flavobacterium sp.]
MRYFPVSLNFLFLVVFCLCFCVPVGAQNTIDEPLLFKESEALVYSKPDEALKIALHLLSKTTSESEKAQINLMVAEIYKVKGDYKNTLVHLFEVNEKNAGAEPLILIKAAVAKSEILQKLYLDNQAQKYFDKAEDGLKSIKDESEKTYCHSLMLLEKIEVQADRQNFKNALGLIEKNTSQIAEASKQYPYFDLWFTISKGRVYLGLNDFEKASLNFKRALEISTKGKVQNNYAEALALMGSANVNFHRKASSLAVQELLNALKTAKEFKNIYLSRDISRHLIDNYIVLNDKANYKFYNTDFLNTNAEIENIGQESLNTAYNLITKDYENKYQAKREGYFRGFYLILGVFVIMVLISAGFWFRYQWDQKRLKDIISYLEITRSNMVLLQPEKKEKVKKEPSKKSSITEETEQLLLNKLKRFENSTRFVNKDMSLAILAGQFDTNIKYLSEVINKHYEVNFNTYINKLRISYIVEKLKSDPNYMNYKISYLAEASGFSSHSSFATVFKSITGLAPVTFIELLKNEKENRNAS